MKNFFRRTPDNGTGPRGVSIRVRRHNRPAREKASEQRGISRQLGIAVILASLFYLAAHYAIVTGIWPVHGSAPGADNLLMRDGIAWAAWLLLFPALYLTGYRGVWGIIALPVIIFFLTRPSLFQLFTDPVYQTRGSARIEANTLKADRARVTTILRVYDEERRQLVFGETGVPATPAPAEAVTEAAAEATRSLSPGAVLPVIVAPIALLLGYLVARHRGVLRWFRDHRQLPFVITLGGFFILTLFFVELGRVGGTTPWELFLPVFVAVWAAVLADDSYNLARPGGVLTLRRFGAMLLYGAMPIVPFLIIRELGLSVVLAGSFATMLLVGTRREWWAGVMLAVWIVLVVAAFNLDDRSATRLQLAINPYRDFSEMTEAETRSWAARMHQFKLFDANVLEGGLLGEGAGRGHPETAPNAADDGYITTIAANWGLLGTISLVMLYTAFIIQMLSVATRERSAFERSLVTGLAMLIAIPFWMAALGGVRAAPLTGVATAFAAHGGAKLLAASLSIGVIAAVSHRRANAARFEAAAESMHGDPDDRGIRIL
ncbi:MAG: FtsW/RodA/SpoVE family cell cycle protein [Gemmatimonadota bacterium]|jgi:cell division protein FtsW (lipid II flippase)|nr:FtsW/RodA/SpoVE family cell cycle protein [Gemmatimonadota bacterium]